MLILSFIGKCAAPVFKGMKHVTQFPKGMQLFNGVIDSIIKVLLATLDTIDAWYDTPALFTAASTAPVVSIVRSKDPSEPMLAAVGSEDMPLVSIRVAGIPLITLLDSGASNKIISEAIAKELGLKPAPGVWTHVELADGGEQKILVQVKLRVVAGLLRFPVSLSLIHI